MKKLFSFTFSIFALLTYGQNNLTNNNQSNQTGNSRPNQIMSIKKDYSDIPAEGSQYLSEDYSLGELYINGKLEKKAQIRYNAFRDDIEVLDNSGSSYTLLKRDYIEAKLDGKLYKIISFEDGGTVKKGYLTPLAEEGNIALYFRSNKRLTKGKEPKAGIGDYIPPQYVDNFDYFISKDKSTSKRIKLNKKSIIENLPGKEKEIKTYISNNKTKLKTETEVIALINYLNAK